MARMVRYRTGEAWCGRTGGDCHGSDGLGMDRMGLKRQERIGEM